MSAITTSIIIGVTAASAGAQLYAAKKGADAAHEAAGMQSDAANKALAAQRSAYDQQRQDFSPYAQAGQAALGRLQQQSAQPRMGFVPGQQASLGQPMPQQQPAQPQGQMATPGQMGSKGGIGASMQGGQVGNVTPGGDMGAMQAAQGAAGVTGGAQIAKPQTGMVVMQGPDGAKRPVPSSVVPQLQQRGFQVVSGG